MALDLKALRRAVGLTQLRVAELMRSRESAVSRIERQSDWKLSTLIDYARALGRTVTITITNSDVTAEIETESLPNVGGVCSGGGQADRDDQDDGDDDE